MSAKNKLLLLLTLACLLLGLFAVLAPFTDIDNDGVSDSLVTEGLLILPVMCVLAALVFLLARFTSPALSEPQFFPYLFFPPPIIPT